MHPVREPPLGPSLDRRPGRPSGAAGGGGRAIRPARAVPGRRRSTGAAATPTGGAVARTWPRHGFRTAAHRPPSRT